jgi:energy-coupling factor transporter ATP-binding protein EcfA2
MIDIENIIIRYREDDPLSEAISGFSLQIAKGEYLAILGRNGSGKSTLIRAICGSIKLNNGRIKINGKDVRAGKFGEDLFGLVGAVFQEPQGQFLMRNVKAEIITVLENLGLTIIEQNQRLIDLCDKFNLNSLLDSKPEYLSGGQMQLVNLACALASNPSILLLDEPTTFLDLKYKNIFLEYLRRLHESGMTIIHITQFPNEAMDADRVCVIESGKLKFNGRQSELFSNEILLSEYQISRPYNANVTDFGRRNSDLTSSKISPNNAIMVVDNISFSYPDKCFSVRIDKLKFYPGQITGLIGPIGSGKTTLALLLSGLNETKSGQIIYAGKIISNYSSKELRKHIGITWQLPDLALIGPTVKDDIQFSLDALHIENVDIRGILSSVGLAGFENRIVDTLSGGEKRKLSIAGILASSPDFIILDEPSAFLDPKSQSEIVEIILKLSESGKGILLIGHDLFFISQLADRIIGIKNGSVCFDIPSSDFFADKAYLDKIGINPDLLKS